MVEDTGQEEMHLTEEEINWVHRETQTRWMSIGGKGEIEHAITVENRATWPGTVGRKIGRE